MSFRRLPFQFTTTDPLERQRELEKRFGVPSQNKMYVDAANPLTMGSGLNTSTNSPRFQHRVPMFVDGMPVHSSVDSSGCENKTPKVRVIPIEIEKDDDVPSSRHRTFSGPPDIKKQQSPEIHPQKDDASTLKRSMEDLSKPSKMKAASGPRVYNIPIKVEQTEVKEKKTKTDKVKAPNAKFPKVNGCEETENVQHVEPESSPKEPELMEEKIMKEKIESSLKKIESVREELKAYEAGVKDFNGTVKDKQYRYLDEMLTRCMIKLDDIETMGNEELRSTRKNAVKMVQACIDLLESKVNTSNDLNAFGNVSNSSQVETTEKQDNPEQSTVMEGENLTNEKCTMEGNPEENQLGAVKDESKSPKNEPLDNHNIPEVEMVEVTSTSSDVDQSEKTGSIDNPVINQSKSTAASTTSEILTEPSESIEIEMLEAKSNIDELQDQKEIPETEVSSTNILNLQKFSVDPTLTPDSNEAEMTDVSSTLEDSKIQKAEAIPEVSSSNAQLDSASSSTEKFSVDSEISENCETIKNVNAEEIDSKCSNNDTNLQLNIPEVEMKETVENSCETNSTDLVDEQSNL